MKLRDLKIQVVQGADIVMKLPVRRIGEKLPVLLFLFRPLAELADLISHKIQLFPGMYIHISVEHSRLGKFCLICAVHFLQDRRLAVYHLIVRQRKEESFALEVPHGEAQFVGRRTPETGIHLHVFQRIMHPSHIPFVVKAKSAILRAFCHMWKFGGVFGGGEDIRVAGFEPLVHKPEKLDAVLIDAAAPVALPVENIAHRVDPQPVEVKTVDPVVRSGKEKAANIVPAEVKVQAAPFIVLDVRKRIFIDAGSVVAFQAEGVHGKMSRNDVQDDSDPVLVKTVHHLHQFLCRSIAGSGTVETGRLIAPGFIAGIFCERKKFYIIISTFLHIGDQGVSQIEVGGVPGAVLLPGARMDLIDVERPLPAVRPVLHPVPVVKMIAVQITYDRGVERPVFHSGAIGVTVFVHVSFFIIDTVCIFHAGKGARYENFIDAAVVHLHQFYDVPAAEVPADAGLPCIWRIGAEHGAAVLRVSGEIFVCIK